MELFVHNVAASDQGPRAAFRRSLHRRGALLFVLLATLGAWRAMGQGEEPVITGAAGFLYTNNDGQAAFQPILNPVVLVPLGRHFLVETSAELQGYIARSGSNGPYEGQFFGTQHATILPRYRTTVHHPSLHSFR